MPGFVYAFVGRAAGGSLPPVVCASHAANAALARGFDDRALEVLRKHARDGAGFYATPLAGDGGLACYTLIASPPHAPPARAALGEGLAPSTTSTSTTTSTDLPPRAVFGVVAALAPPTRGRGASSSSSDGDATDPQATRAFRWLETTRAEFERRHGDATSAVAARPRGLGLQHLAAFGVAIKAMSSELDETPRATRVGEANDDDDDDEKLREANEKLRDVRAVMVDNISRVIDRGEKLENVLDKSDALQATAHTFKRASNRLRRRMWWGNVKMWCAVVGVAALALIVIFFAACRGVACVT